MGTRQLYTSNAVATEKENEKKILDSQIIASLREENERLATTNERLCTAILNCRLKNSRVMNKEYAEENAQLKKQIDMIFIELHRINSSSTTPAEQQSSEQ